jgi:DNA-binding NtrC family response regulator
MMAYGVEVRRCGRRMVLEKRILVVDHDPLVLFTLHAALEKLGPELRTVAAKDCTEAIDKARGETFDVILLEIRLPGMGGIALTRELKALCTDPVVIWFTYHESRAVAVEANNLGVYRCLEKPMWIADIRRAVREALDVAAAERQLS